MVHYWYINCNVCEQGRLFVHKNIETGSLMLECEECSAAWYKPEQAVARDSGFLAIDIPSEYATTEEIKAAGWQIYPLHRVED